MSGGLDIGGRSRISGAGRAGNRDFIYEESLNFTETRGELWSRSSARTFCGRRKVKQQKILLNSPVFGEKENQGQTSSSFFESTKEMGE